MDEWLPVIGAWGIAAIYFLWGYTVGKEAGRQEKENNHV